ncbi:MAG: TetR/AcrR family transcriptional regulator [Aristaeellaceae bacterium]
MMKTPFQTCDAVSDERALTFIVKSIIIMDETSTTVTFQPCVDFSTYAEQLAAFERGMIMGEKKEYRSSIRSRRLIRESMISLLKEKELSKITVKDIVDRADLNRATFYVHYPDVRGVMEEFENETIAHLKEVLTGVQFEKVFQNPTPFLLKINRYLEEDLDFYRTLILSGGSDQFLEKMKNICIKYMYSDTDIPAHIQDSVALQMHICFFADGIIGIYRRWFKGELTGSLNDIAMQLSMIISQSARKLLEK